MKRQRNARVVRADYACISLTLHAPYKSPLAAANLLRPAESAKFATGRADGRKEVPFIRLVVTMFCPTCQQDVPALAVPEEPGVVRCAFCSEELGLGERNREPEARDQESEVGNQESERLVLVSAELETRAEPGSKTRVELSCSTRVSDPAETADRSSPEPRSALPLPPRPDLDNWDLEPEMRSAERLLKGLRQSAPVESMTTAHAAYAAPVRGNPLQRGSESAEAGYYERSGSLAWMCLSLGVMALACGIVLIVWSLVEERGDLWSLGLPLAFVGQGGLVIGLLMQLEGLWRNSKRTQETLTQLDGKLHDLTHTTTMLGTTRSTPAQSFYVHMAEGASPHLLLADLKGQLDLLAERMSRK